MATNFLIGRGEVLTSIVPPPRRAPSERPVYTLAEARRALVPQIKASIAVFDKAPADAFPDDVAVARMVLNPTYIARSYYPQQLLKEVGLEAVGSRTTRVKPRKWGRKGKPEEVSTTELFVAGQRKAFRSLPQWVEAIDIEERSGQDFTHLEEFSALLPEAKVKAFAAGTKPTYEVGIHAVGGDFTSLQESFLGYAQKTGVKVISELGFTVGNLWFVPVRGTQNQIEVLSCFSLVRVIRPMPALRSMRPLPPPTSVKLPCQLPTSEPLSSRPRVAILDGGLPDHHPIGPWVRTYEHMDADANYHADGPSHGLAVSSAFLFGPIEPGGEGRRPYSFIDHLRVVDEDSDEEDPVELYRTIALIDTVLLARSYEFINLSLGPEAVVDDGDPHGWTSLIDERLSDGRTFMTVAVGNNGEEDAIAQLNRVQVPGDCVNVVAVGAADSVKSGWDRASYSAIGPGRSPGFVKPDLLAFGGSSSSYFHALSAGRRPALAPQLGTSFAAPYLLRSAVGVRAIMGPDLSTLAIKALLVHGAEKTDDHHQNDVGWGKIPEDVRELITCDEGVARVVYQGELSPGKFMRAALPIPKAGLSGRIRLKATFCFATPTDPHHSGSYTKSGLEIAFRPDSDKIEDEKQNADTRSFFKLKKYANEETRRSDSGKWENVLHAEARMLGKSLNRPVFDVHYIAREGAGPTRNAGNIPYALVLTIEAPKHPNLFSSILADYKMLSAIQPDLAVPIPAI